jgi:hypothetical protein
MGQIINQQERAVKTPDLVGERGPEFRSKLNLMAAISDP